MFWLFLIQHDVNLSRYKNGVKFSSFIFFQVPTCLETAVRDQMWFTNKDRFFERHYNRYHNDP